MQVGNGDSSLAIGGRLPRVSSGLHLRALRTEVAGFQSGSSASSGGWISKALYHVALCHVIATVNGYVAMCAIG